MFAMQGDPVVLFGAISFVEAIYDHFGEPGVVRYVFSIDSKGNNFATRTRAVFEGEPPHNEVVARDVQARAATDNDLPGGFSLKRDGRGFSTGGHKNDFEITPDAIRKYQLVAGFKAC